MGSAVQLGMETVASALLLLLSLLPPGVTITATLTTTDKDFDNEKFPIYEHDDPQGLYDVSMMYERTVWPSVLPSTQLVHRTPLTIVTANPWTVGLLDTDTVDRAELYTAQSYYLTP